MRPELNQRLREDYPEIFANKCEISCDDGWFNILNTLCGCIQNHIDARNRNLENNLKFNRMADALAAGDDILFLDYYGTMSPNFIQDRRADILAGQRREIWEPCDQVVALQIKEKFGTLRFYAEGGDAYTVGMTQMAESMSAVTCECCGAPGTTAGSGWIRTLCARHHEERSKS